MICRKISVSYERQSDYEQALSWIDEALARLPGGHASVAAEVMASKSVTLFRTGAYADAIDWGKRAVSLARRSRDRRIMAYAHTMLANSYIEQGSLKQAVRHLSASTRLYTELRDLRGQSAAGNNLASCYQLLGNMDRALYYYQEALQADARLGNVTHAAIIHNNIGEVLLTLGRVTEAQEHLREVLTTHAANPGLAALAGLSEVNLSRCALARGDIDGAEKQVSRGMRRLRKVGAQGLLDEAELQLVEVRLAQERWKDALKRAAAVVERSRASGAQLMEARGDRMIGVARLQLGEFAAAEEHLRASATLARKIAASIEEVHALIALSRLMVDSGRLKQAARRIARARVIADSVGDARAVAAFNALTKGIGDAGLL
jgi:tetratricopeptide (TPR) repeat protein